MSGSSGITCYARRGAIVIEWLDWAVATGVVLAGMTLLWVAATVRRDVSIVDW